jgi:hypothetical protein
MKGAISVQSEGGAVPSRAAERTPDEGGNQHAISRCSRADSYRDTTMRGVIRGHQRPSEVIRRHQAPSAALACRDTTMKGILSPVWALSFGSIC